MSDRATPTSSPLRKPSLGSGAMQTPTPPLSVHIPAGPPPPSIQALPSTPVRKPSNAVSPPNSNTPSGYGPGSFSGPAPGSPQYNIGTPTAAQALRETFAAANPNPPASPVRMPSGNFSPTPPTSRRESQPSVVTRKPSMPQPPSIPPPPPAVAPSSCMFLIVLCNPSSYPVSYPPPVLKLKPL